METMLAMTGIEKGHSMDIFSEHIYDVVTNTQQRPLKRNNWKVLETESRSCYNRSKRSKTVKRSKKNIKLLGDVDSVQSPYDTQTTKQT